ncbi:outer membrane protein assembly factor BamC [Methylophilaceae bacterium]|nr:outer membrane protein assembly factor BamC [Methylophilaceae bacterium]
MKKLIGLPILALILCACSFKPLTDKFNEVTAPDYVNSSKAEKLQLPPDLSEYETSDTYNVPGAATSYTDFENQRNRKIEKVELLKEPNGIKLVKSGNFRWLIVNKSPDKIWPHLEDFWYEQGFDMKKTNRRLGIMETEWTTPENIEEELGMADTFDSWLESLSGDDEKTKFRTRLEKGSQANSTEIFISHRKRDGVNSELMEAVDRMREGSYVPDKVYAIPEYKSDEEKKEPVPSGDIELTEIDLQINAEIMRRLLVFLGMQDLEAKKIVEKPQVIVKAKLINNNGKSIELYEPFDRSWRRVSIALDMIGFLTEDRDRSKGLYYVTYTNLDIGESDKKAKEEEGWLDSIDFWSDDEAEAEKMAEEETGVEDGDIRNKGRRSKKEKEEEEVLDTDAARAIGKGGANKNEGSAYKFDLDCMFSDECDKEPEARSYLIKLTEADSGTYVSIDNPDGTKNNSPTADAILNILYDYLR